MNLKLFVLKINRNLNEFFMSKTVIDKPMFIGLPPRVFDFTTQILDGFVEIDFSSEMFDAQLRQNVHQIFLIEVAFVERHLQRIVIADNLESIHVLFFFQR